MSGTQLPPWWPKAAATLGAAAATALLVRYLSASESSTTAAPTRSLAASAHDAVDSGPNPKIVNVAQHDADMKGKKNPAPVTKEILEKAGDIGKYLAFQSEYRTQLVARPDVGEGELVKVTDWRLLTPKDYDRTCFHIEVDVSGTKMEHLVNGSQGKALSVYAVNDKDKVHEFLKEMKLDPNEVVSVEEIAPPDGEGCVVLTTVEKLFTQYLDIFGKPTREFLKKLFPFAQDIMERVTIAELTLDRKAQEFQDRQANAITFADYITEFKSLRIPVQKYVELIPTIKQRVYSICSSSDYRPGKCQLLVVREDWQIKSGGTKYGLCSSFLTFLRPGSYCVGHSTHSVMQMPKDKKAYIFMAGLGTGLAPFRAYVEQRKFEKSQGHKVGPMMLFFGGRHAKAEYYYRDEFEGYEKEGLVKCCNAWSRDQKQKIYVQHKILEEEDTVWEHLGKEGSKGYFFLCGSKNPERDVFNALVSIWQKKGGMTEAQALAKMEQLQAAGRYVTEVY